MKTKINKFDFDFVRLETEIRKLEKDYLTEITEENVKYFSESTKMIAEMVLENYFLEIDNHYSEGVFKIKDEEKLSAFIDFATGYRSLMKEWVKDHEIQLKERKINKIALPDEPNYNKNKPTVIAGVGTVIAVGLYIFTNIWVALLAELLVLGLAYKEKEKQQKADIKYEVKLRQYEIQIEQERAKLVNGLINELKEWLEQARVKSDELLCQFNIK